LFTLIHYPILAYHHNQISIVSFPGMKFHGLLPLKKKRVAILACSFAISMVVQAFDVNNKITGIPWSHAVTCQPGVPLQEFIAIFST